MGFSSVSFMGWIFCGVRFGVFVTFTLFFIYFFVSGGLFLVFKSCRFYRLAMLSKFKGFPVFIGVVVRGVLSLRGLPPFRGFLLKVIPIGLVVLSSKLFYLCMLIPGALLSLFFYLRLLFKIGFLIPPIRLRGLRSFRFDTLGYFNSLFIGWLLRGSIFGFLYVGIFLGITF